MDAHLDALLATLRAAHRNFIDAANGLNPTQRSRAGVCGEWSPKDVAAHLVGWDASLKQLIVDIDNFDPPYDVHAFNRASVAARKDLRWEAVMNELEANFTALAEAVATVEAKMSIYPHVRSWMAGRIEDYKLHTDQIEAWLRE